MNVSPAPYEVIIERSRGWLRMNWRELWDYRDLFVVLIQRDVISRYKQTLLGPLWFILQPLLTTLVFAIVFGRVAGIPTDGIPAPLFYLCGLLGWGYFAQNITTAGSTFVTNAGLFGKVWFPRLIVPAATVASNLVAFALQLVTFALFLAYYRWFAADAGAVQLTWRAPLVILPLLQIILLSLGVSLWMAASTAKYRDLVHFNTYLVQLWMFATPVIYPLSRVEQMSPALKWLVVANPISVPIEAFRYCLLGRGTVGTAEIAISLTLTLLLLVSGILVYQKVERTVVDAA